MEGEISGPVVAEVLIQRVAISRLQIKMEDERWNRCYICSFPYKSAGIFIELNAYIKSWLSSVGVHLCYRVDYSRRRWQVIQITIPLILT